MSAGRALQVAGGLAALVLVYALTLGSFKALDLLFATIVGSLVLAIFRGFLFTRAAPGAGELARRTVAVPAFVLVVAREVLTGTWEVGRAVLSRRPVVKSGLVAVPMGERSDLGVAVSSFAVTLTPGELVVDLDWERRAMLVHALDAEDPDRIRAQIDGLYDGYQRRVFP